MTAAGGTVVKSPTKEVGFIAPDQTRFKVELTEAGRKDPLFQGLGDSFNVFHLHGETVELTTETSATNPMTLLGTGEFCHNQIVRVGVNVYGLQCHFELTPEMFETWLREDSDLLQLDQAALRVNFETIRDEYTRVGRKLMENFLRVAGV